MYEHDVFLELPASFVVHSAGANLNAGSCLRAISSAQFWVSASIQFGELATQKSGSKVGADQHKLFLVLFKGLREVYASQGWWCAAVAVTATAPGMFY